MQPEIAGVSDFNARFYDAALGRFMMIDPLADANQESGNPYHFSFDNPVQFVDPSGLSPAWSTGFGSSEKTDAEQQMDRLQQAQEEKEKADGFVEAINDIIKSLDGQVDENQNWQNFTKADLREYAKESGYCDECTENDYGRLFEIIFEYSTMF